MEITIVCKTQQNISIAFYLIKFPTGKYALAILKPLCQDTGIEIVSKWWVMGTSFLTVFVEGLNKQTMEARMSHVLMNYRDHTGDISMNSCLI